MDEEKLFRIRIALLQAFLWRNRYDGILLSRCDNYAMATGGRRNFIYTYGDLGANSLFVTQKGAVHFVGNTIEAPRQTNEELCGLSCDVPLQFPWFDGSPAGAVNQRFSGNFCSDDGSLGPNVNAQLAALRAALTEFELEKYRCLGKLAAEAMSATVRSITSGMTESLIAARLVYEGWQRQCHVPVALVAADDRIRKYRHPLPTSSRLIGAYPENAVKKYVMVVGCFMREGLVVSLTRFKQVDDLPEKIIHDQERIAAVDAILHEETIAGRTLGDVFTYCQQAYRSVGFCENEWHNHHQGGSTGYAGRTCKASPAEPFPILDNSWAKSVKEVLGEEINFGMAFAWNPSAPGVKSEDTFILLPDGRKEIVTSTPDFPAIDLEKVLGRSTDVTKSGFVAW